MSRASPAFRPRKIPAIIAGTLASPYQHFNDYQEWGGRIEKAGPPLTLPETQAPIPGCITQIGGILIH